MKLKQILIGIFIITSFSCYNALEEVYDEANLNPASLASLDIFPGSMSPGFDSDTTSYSVSVENGYSSVTVTPEAVDRGASLQYCIDSGSMTPCVSGSGITVNSLDVGTPKVLAIEVNASGGSVKKTYTVSITRQGSADATLSGLSVSAGTLNPGFSSGTESYTLSVPNANTSVNITPVTNTTTATLRYRIDSGLWNTTTSGSPVTVGSLAVNVTKTLYVEVTAQNGTTVKTYVVTINRMDNNANLSGLNVSSGTLTPVFAAAAVNYSVSVANSVTSVTVTPTSASAYSTLRYRIDGGSWYITTSGNGININGLSSGVVKLLEIEITSQDNHSIKTYSLSIRRMYNDANLADLTVSSGNLLPGFNENTLSYSLSLENSISSVTIVPILPAYYSTMRYKINTGSWNTITSGTSLVINSLVEHVTQTIYIEITSEDSSIVRTYNVLITRLYIPGSVWTPVVIPGAITTTKWRSITSSLDGSKLAAVADDYYICTSTNSGLTWTPRTSIGITNWNGIASSADGTKLAAVINGGYIYTSSDSGATWIQRSSSGNRSWYGIVSSYDGSKLAAVSNQDYIFISSDSGATWFSRTEPGTGHWRNITSSSDGLIIAASTDISMLGKTYISYDSGIHWTSLDVSPGFTGSWRGLTSSANGSKLAAAAYSGYIHTSSNGGASWVQRASNRDWSCISSSSDGTVLAAAVKGGNIYISTDSGLNWTSRAFNANWYSICVSSDGLKFAAVIDGSNSIYISNP